MFAAAVICAAFAQLPPLTEKTADEYLAQLQSEQTDYFARLETVAKSLVGVPYARDPLGEGPSAPYDRDPLFDLSRVDEFSYVDLCIALAGSHTLEDATQALLSIRYEGGEVDFMRRNLFFVEDWALNNTFVTNITPSFRVALRGLMRFIDKKIFFKDTAMESLYADVRAESITIHYIYEEDIAKAVSKIPDNSLIAIIGKQGTHFADNCGLHFRDSEDGPGILYYASPKAGRVVAGTVEEALTKSLDYIGILVYSLHPERMAFVEQAAPESEQAEPADGDIEPAAP